MKRMQEAAIDEMARLEDTHWWFVGKRALVASALVDVPPGRALDIGCGTGGVVAALGGRGPVVGTDVSPLSLAHARRRGAAALVGAAVEHLPFRAGVFDLVTALDVIEHTEDDRHVLAEIRAVLAPGGVLLVSVPAFPLLWSTHDEVLGHRRRYTKASLARALDDAGFRIIRMTYTNTSIFPLVAAWRLLGRVRRRPGRGTDFFSVPQSLNRLLIGLYHVEAALIRRVSLPVGLSLLCLARPA